MSLCAQSIVHYRPAIVSGDSDKASGDVAAVETERLTVNEETAENEQTAEKVAPLFSQPATIVTIDTEACTHEVLYYTVYLEILRISQLKEPQ